MAVCEVLNPYLKLYPIPESSQIEDKPPPKKIPRECYSSEHAVDLYRIGTWDKCIGGLINVGYNCYINSSLQCLFYTPGYQVYLTNLSRSIYQKNTEGPFFLRALGDIINEMQKSKSVCPSYIMNNAWFLNESWNGRLMEMGRNVNNLSRFHFAISPSSGCRILKAEHYRDQLSLFH